VRFEDLTVLTVKKTIFNLAEIYQCFSTTYRSMLIFTEIRWWFQWFQFRFTAFPEHAYLFGTGV